MNNKTDRSKTSAQESLHTRSHTTHAVEKKRRGLFLLMDLLLLVCIVSAVFFLILAFTPLRLGSGAEMRQIVYTVELSAVDQSFVSLLKERDQVTDSATGAVLGVVSEIRIRPYEAYTSLPTPEVDEELGKHVVRKETNEEWNTITVTIRANAEYEAGVGYTCGGARIAVGAEYELQFPAYAGKGECLTLVPVQGEEAATK